MPLVRIEIDAPVCGEGMLGGSGGGLFAPRNSVGRITTPGALNSPNFQATTPASP